MIIFLRIIPITTALLVYIAFELMILRPHTFWVVLPIVAVLSLVPSGVLMTWKTDQREFWHLLITPFVLLGSTTMLMVFVGEAAISHTMAIVTTVLYGWYLENLFLFYHQTFRYQPYSLENTTRYSNLLAVFFLSSALFAARIFLNINVFVVIAAGVAMIALLTLQFLWAGKVPWKRGKFTLIVLTVVMGEFFAVMLALPTSFFVSGLLLTIPFYLMMNLARHAMDGTLDVYVLRRYTIIGLGSFALTFFSAPWK